MASIEVSLSNSPRRRKGSLELLARSPYSVRIISPFYSLQAMLRIASHEI